MIRTRRERLIAALPGAAICVYAISWFLPAVNGSGDPGVARLPSLAGWNAFTDAIVFAFESTPSSGDFPFALFATVSAATNAAFVGAVAVWLRPGWTSRSTRRWRIALFACAALNLGWIGIAGSDLRVAYYAWVASFVFFGGALPHTPAPRSRGPRIPVPLVASRSRASALLRNECLRQHVF